MEASARAWTALSTVLREFASAEAADVRGVARAASHSIDRIRALEARTFERLARRATHG